MTQRILVPIDLSDFSQKVISIAIAQAKLIPNSEIHLVHVTTLDIGIIVSETGFSYIPELEETAMREEAEQLNNLKEMVEKENIPCHIITKQGIPSDLIIETAEEINADLICIGSLGHNALYKMFIGSVASEVIKKSHVPLLVVPKGK
ncbi:MAG: universal stress protein [Weeksellaceae bacterium]